MTKKELFTELIDKYVSGTLTRAEWQQLSEGLQDPENLACLDEELLLSFMNHDFQLQEPAEKTNLLTTRILEKIRSLGNDNSVAPEPFPITSRPKNRLWRWAAAAAVLILTGSVYFWQQNNSSQAVPTTSLTANADKPPGRNGAILKLSDGTEVVLDSMGNGLVANQGGSDITLTNGKLQYDPNQAPAAEPVYNTMTTPNGRQFQLLLPDGTKVWLNAASSITYPVTFSNASRDVTVSGEAYFEVAKMKAAFRVTVNNAATVEVLGTHFNIKAYTEENNIQTTLLEGSVKTTALKGNNGSKAITLAPGQQARIDDRGSLNVANQVDIDRVMAWKNGLFNFENASLDEVMRQLARWYDIEVVYEKGIPNMKFGGEMSRNISLTGVLSGLERAGVHFRISEGNRLIVTP